MDIQTALAQFADQPLLKAARGLFKNTLEIPLGTLADTPISPQRFFHKDYDAARHDVFGNLYLVGRVNDDSFLAAKAAQASTDLQSAISEAAAADYQGMFIIAADLGANALSRADLAAHTRNINRVFTTPVIVVFKHQAQKQSVLSIGVANRRPHKRDKGKDVLGKVSMIREIRVLNPHRGHLEILKDFSLEELEKRQGKGRRGQKIDSFKSFHAALEEIFNTELLNKRFYEALANWYFWALPQVEFPADLEPDDEKRRATGLIRLLTRLIFCWFLKEKDGLIPEKLFESTELKKILKGFDPESETSSTFYLAILQNLFFATLNQRMGKDGKGNPYRTFAKDEGFQKNRNTYDVNNLYRYENLFAIPEDQALAIFADIPFLNGGLFECLDRTEDGTNKKLYLDGFSRNSKKRPHVPDRLFFDSGETADLSVAYGDKKRKAEEVTGLITILNRYKFTIAENTPIDQEIALDPELLGKVFENLLASYNEETKTTARKQTGSFYTPRPIVDYMVDESLKAHLKQKVEQTFLSASLSDSASLSNPVASNQDISKTHRDLPHWKKDGAIYWVTFRMADSLPQDKLRAWKQECEDWRKHHPVPWDDAAWKEYNERFGEKLEAWLDAGMGSRALARPEVREAVKSCLLRFDGERLILHAAVIMPNHVHALLEPIEGHDLSKLLQGIKGASARAANNILGATGSTFWLDESYDHIVRSEAQYRHFVRYIAENPCKARLKNHEYWLKEGGAQEVAGISVCASLSIRQTGMSAPLSERLNQLFTYTDEPHQFTDAEVAALITAIDEVKILDPACGSGAFPMGVLHKLVYLLSKLDPCNEKWRDIQISRVQAAIQAAEKIDDSAVRDSAVGDLQKQIASIHSAFDNNELDYGRKLYLIEKCLYGVDIQPIAIQISKLRFFISLVCDQKTNRNKKDNHGIRPLPNLETKFVAADTLIGLPISDKDLFIDALIAPIEKEIEDAYHSHFTIQRRDQKLALQKKIKVLRIKLADTLAGSLGALNSKKAQHLAEWDPFDPQSTADFFDPHWMFGRSLKDGFDVVIGNPPYIDVKALPGNAARLYFQLFTTAKNRINLYALFIEKGRALISNGGILSFIIPNSLLVGESYSKLRELILPDLMAIVKLPDGVFENAIVETMLLFVCRSSTLPTVAAAAYGNCEQIDFANVRYTSFPKCDWAANRETRFSIFSTEADDRICIKMEKASTLFEDVGEFCLGLTPYDKHKGHSPELIEQRQFHSARKLNSEYVPLISGTNITPYAVSDSVSEWLKYGPWLGAPRDRRFFTEERIIIRQIASGRPPRIFAGYTTKALYHSQIGFAILAKKNTGVPLKLLLALLNSKLLNFYHGMRFLDREKITFQKVLIANVRKFPLTVPPKNVSTEILLLVDEILQLKDANPSADTSALEREIDQQVYALYGLTPEEIGLVEGEGKSEAPSAAAIVEGTAR